MFECVSFRQEAISYYLILTVSELHALKHVDYFLCFVSSIHFFLLFFNPVFRCEQIVTSAMVNSVRSLCTKIVMRPYCMDSMFV